MLIPFCEFTLATDGSPKIAVNPLLVSYLAALPNGNTKIVFDEKHNILVKQGFDEVVRGLAG